MDYRQAQKIRQRSLSDVIAANLVAGESTMGAIGKAISQKSAARFTRLKEKFDILNIVKFMTGGSKLAPALIGKMLGRSRRDIEYFAGTARILNRGTTTNRIGALPGDDSNLDILTGMYEFMKKTQENEMRRFELKRNYEEENKLEDEKRHKALIRAITGAGGPVSAPTNIPTKSDDGGIFGSIMKMIEDIRSMLTSLKEGLKSLEWLKGIKSMADLGKWALTIFGSATAAGIIGAVVMGALSTLGIFSAAQSRKQQAILDIVRDVPKGIKGREADVKDYEDAIKTALANKTPEEKKYFKYLLTTSPDLTEKQKEFAGQAFANIENPKPKAPVTLPTGEMISDDELKKRQQQNWDKFNKPAVQPSTTTNPGQKLNSVTQENRDLSLSKTSSATVTKTVNNVNTTQAQYGMFERLSKISVRNPEETFQRMIYYSTRVV